MQTCDAVEFCQAVAARCSEEGRGRSTWPPSPHTLRSSSAVSDGLLAPVDERSAVLMAQSTTPSPFEKQSRISWESR